MRNTATTPAAKVTQIPGDNPKYKPATRRDKILIGTLQECSPKPDIKPSE